MSFLDRLTGRRPRTLVPRTVLDNLPGALTDRLVTYDGRCLRERPDPLPDFQDFLGPTMAAARVDPSRTIAEIAEAAEAQGGWALCGGYKLLEDAVGPECDDPRYLALLDAALEFLRDSGCSGLSLNGYEAQRWADTHGSMASFWNMEAVAVPPSGAEPPVADLSPGEVRLVARLEDRADSNTILVKRAPNGGYVAVNEAPWTLEDPRRGQWDWLTADDLHGLLRRIGESLTLLPFWVSDDLRPYIPYRRRTARD